MRAGSTGGQPMVLPGHAALRYAAAVLLAAVSAGIRIAAAPVLGASAPFTLFYPGILIAAWYLGTGPAIAALAASIAFSVFFVLPTGGSGGVSPSEWLALALFILVAMVLIAMVEMVRRSRAKAAAAETRTREVLEGLKAGVAILDKAGRYTFVNAEGERLLGAAPGELTGKEARQAGLNPRTAERLDAAMARGETSDLEVHSESSDAWLLIRTFPTRGGAAMFFLDITESKRAQKASQDTAEALQQALKAARMGHWSWDLATGKVSWSENLEEVHGMPRGAFAGKLESFEALVHPDDVAEVKGAIASALQDRKDYDIEFRVLPPGGRVVWIRGLGHAVHEDGVAVRMTGVGMDITEQKEREADRRLLAAIVDSTDDAIVSKDLTGRILSWNRSAERTFGYSAEEAVGRSIAMLMPPQGADDFFSIIGRIREGKRVEHYETFRRRKDGTIIEVSLTVSPVHDEKGNVIGASKIARDITSVRAAERDRQRIRDLFLGILGHDLRNPLNTIVASLYTLEKKVQPELQHIFPRISRSAERMARMIDQLLDFTRARLGEGLRLHPRRANLRDICAAVVEELEPQYPCRVRFTAEGDLDSEWDGDRIAQALSNLVGNALDYGSPDRAVEVHLGRENGSARIEVTNEGPPIPEELRPTIFEPFRRGTGDEQRNRRGLGLGLFITREIVRAHRGTIELLSEGGRTTFVLRLPFAAAAQKAV